MQIRNLILMAWLLGSSLPAFAESCPNMRLDQAGGPMAKQPVYDQGGLDLCYAYTAAQMVDAWRSSQGAGEKLTSPLALAAAYSALRVENGRPKPRPWVNGGSFEWAINTARGMRAGLCGAEEVKRHFTEPRRSEKDFTVLFNLHERHGKAGANARQREVVQEALRQALRQRGYTPAMLQGLGDLGRLLNEGTASQLVHRVIAKTCEGRGIDLTRVPEPRVIDVHKSGSRDSRESDLARYLKEIFGSANPQPVGIGYCADFLAKASVVRNLETNPSRDRPGAVEGCALEHASVVIGSRERNGTCEFLIRNTLGPSCKGYDRAWDCENGQIWVSERALVKNTNRAAWLEGPEPRR